VPQPVTARSVASLNEVVSTASVASHRASEANPPVQLATAPATSAPATIPPPRLVPIVREEPEFPREAMLSNITRGRVVARLTIDQEGHVSKVDIVSAEPAASSIAR
jgi:outer membrane biosynthesis protein TonB